MSEKSGFVWAVRTGDLATVQDAVNKGENVNAVDATVNKRTPLHHAADFGQTEVINYLISKGAKVDTKDAHGITPLLAATYEGHANAVSALINAGADHKIAGPDGQTALGAAESEEVKEVLKRAGAK